MIRKLLPLLLVTLSGLWFTPNYASLQLALFSMGIIGLILLLTLFIVGAKEKWGLLPGVDLGDIYVMATQTPEGSAKVFQSLIILICVILYVAAK